MNYRMNNIFAYILIIVGAFLIYENFFEVKINHELISKLEERVATIKSFDNMPEEPYERVFLIKWDDNDNVKDLIDTLHFHDKDVYCSVSISSLKSIDIKRAIKEGKMRKSDKGINISGKGESILEPMDEEFYVDIGRPTIQKMIDDRIQNAIVGGCDGILLTRTYPCKDKTGLSIQCKDNEAFLEKEVNKIKLLKKLVGYVNSGLLLDNSLIKLTDIQVSEFKDYEFGAKRYKKIFERYGIPVAYISSEMYSGRVEDGVYAVKVY